SSWSRGPPGGCWRKRPGGTPTAPGCQASGRGLTGPSAIRLESGSVPGTKGSAPPLKTLPRPDAVAPESPAPSRSTEPLIFCENLVKIYKVADLEVVALQGLDLIVRPAELLGIVGNSGSGKSTLLNILGGLDRPSAGRVSVAGRDLLKMSEWGLVKYKREVVGFVWQQTS